jgi:voltage-gated potassium channel
MNLSALRRDPDARSRALAAYQGAADIPLLLLGLAIIPVIVLPFVTDFSHGWDVAFTAADWTIWAAFGLDLTVKTYLAERRRQSLAANWLDAVIVAVSLPVFLVDLRPLRVLRSGRALRVARMLRLVRVVAFGSRFLTRARQLAGRNGMAYVMVIATALLFLGATLVYLFERSGGGEIDDFGTAIWWAIVTVTTVGYGDVVPTSAAARGVAVFLMILGISVFGFVTANVAAFFVELSGDKSKASLEDVLAKLDSLEHEVRALRRERDGGGPPEGSSTVESRVLTASDPTHE